MTTVEIPRDRWGKPLIIPPGGGKPVPYYRASSFGDVLDDRTNLEKWKIRKAIKGVAASPSLTMAVATTPETEKWALNKLAEDAVNAAGGSERASIGTSLHSLTELLDRDLPLPPYPEQYEADVEAYRQATAPFTHHLIEEFVVNDELGVAGTPDRVSWLQQVVEFEGVALGPQGSLIICDLKTGSSGGEWLAKHAVQLAIYSRSCLYNPVTGARRPMHDTLRVDKDWGVIFWAPAGEGRCELFALDLQAGWDGALLAADVRKWRKRKGLVSPININQQEAA